MSETERKPLPIMMSGRNPRLILEGKKTVTRRPLRVQPGPKAQAKIFDKEQPFAPHFDEIDFPHGLPQVVAEWWEPATEDAPNGHDVQIQCPHWQGPGTRLYVKEPYATAVKSSESIVYKADGQCVFLDTRGDLRCCGWLVGSEPELEPADRYERKLFKNWVPGMYMARRFSRCLIEVTNVGLEQLSQITEEQARLEGCADRAEFLEIWRGLYPEGPNAVEADPWVWVETFRLAQDADREAERTERRNDPRYQDALQKIPGYQARAEPTTTEVTVVAEGIHGCSHLFDFDARKLLKICRYCERTIREGQCHHHPASGGRDSE